MTRAEMIRDKERSLEALHDFFSRKLNGSPMDQEDFAGTISVGAYHQSLCAELAMLEAKPPKNTVPWNDVLNAQTLLISVKGRDSTDQSCIDAALEKLTKILEAGAP